jgi:feruloyl-CoA synthase
MESGLRPAQFAPARIICAGSSDGGRELSSPIALPDRLDLLIDRLRHWATVAPERTLIAERDGAGWRRMSYADVWRQSAHVAAGLLARGVDRERPLLIGGAASIDQLLLRLGAMRIGLPFAPVSPSLLRHGGARRLTPLLARLRPGLITLSVDCARDWPSDAPQDAAVLPMEAARSGGALRAAPSPALDAVERNVGLDTPAAIFFTSGSMGEPKGVTVTHRNISANQSGYAALWPFLSQEPPILLDWLPWHHIFGGNDNIHKTIWNGGAYFIDDGAPAAECFARSIDNIRAIRPTIHVNVPRGIAMLADRLENDEALFRDFFHRLDVLFFAGAAMSEDLWRRLLDLVARARRTLGREIALVSGYGSTESGSTISLVHFPIDRPNRIGLPLPGFSLRLVPVADKLEVRIKGPSVTPGYWNDPERTRGAFDSEGYFMTGDAARFADAHDPAGGLVFDGRIGEDFKLSSGTWASVGPLRTRLVAALAPLARDVLIAGEGRDALGAIIFIDDTGGPQPVDKVEIAARLAAHNAAHPASSARIFRAIIAAEAPSAALGEINDKGQVNQRLALANRAAVVEALFAEPPPLHAIIPETR